VNQAGSVCGEVSNVQCGEDVYARFVFNLVFISFVLCVRVCLTSGKIGFVVLLIYLSANAKGTN